ncbi:MAG: CoA-transferase [Burkholderiaceae bacterium]
MSLMTLQQIAQAIPDGSKIAVLKDDSGAVMATAAALIDRGARDLHMVCVPISGLLIEWLLQARAVRTLESSAVTLAEFGGAPRFGQAVREGEIRLLDATCPAVYAGLQASEKGIPFTVLRGILDSDLLARRDDWKVIANPFAEDDPIVAIKAIDPDISLIHAPAADRFGNVYIGRDRNTMLLGHAAKACYATVEEIVEGNLLDDPIRSGSVLPSVYVDGVAHVPQACWPLGFDDHYDDDREWISSYLAAARDPEAFADWWQRARQAAPWARLLPMPEISPA